MPAGYTNGTSGASLLEEDSLSLIDDWKWYPGGTYRLLVAHDLSGSMSNLIYRNIKTRTNSSFPSRLKPLYQGKGLVHNHSHENEFNLLVNEISISYERMGTKTCFEKEAKGNSEIACYTKRRKSIRFALNSNYFRAYSVDLLYQILREELPKDIAGEMRGVFL